MNAPRKISEAGLVLLKSFEGLRLESYRDSVGILTIGFGHTGPKVCEGLTCSRERANDLLKQDVADAEEAIHQSVKVEISQRQFDALVCLTYNIGARAFKTSTLLRLLNGGKMVGAADQFLKWNHAGGRQVAGLTKRRQAEHDLFLS